MNFLKIIFLIASFIPAGVMAQKVMLKDQQGSPVPQAVMVIKQLENNRESVFLSDNSGIVKIGEKHSKLQVVVSHVSFELFVDTVDHISGDFSITLKEKDVTLNEVVVTSEYTARTAGESVHPVMVINRSQIENQAATNLEQVLAQQLNIRISQDQALGSGLTMNGLSGQHIKFLVDGVPVIGRLDGNIDISQLNLNNVERIEVVNGPMASSYGTDASGGVINLITKQQVTDRIQASANFLYESIGHYNTDFLAGHNRGKSSFVLSGGRNFFDGWSKADTGRWQEWKPKEQLFGNAKYRWVGKKLIMSYQLNAFNETVSNKGVPRITPYFAYAFDEYYTTTRLTNQVNGSYIIKPGYHVNGTVAYSNYIRHKNTFRKDLVSLNEILVPGIEQQDTTIMNSWMIRSTFSHSPNNATFSYQAGIDFNVDRAEGTRFNDQTITSGDYAIFASGEYQVHTRLEVKPAIRLSHNTDYKTPVVPSVMLRYDIGKSTQLRFSYGKGFRAPGIKERYLYFVDINHNIRGNENLLPEYSDNFYLHATKQIKYRKSTNSLEVSGFFNDVRNAITLAQPDPSASLYTYINLGKFSTHGVNFLNTYSINNFTFGAGLSYTGRYNIYADSGNFSKYIYSPDLNAKTQYNFNGIDLTASVYFKHNGKLPGYQLNADNTISQFSNESYNFFDITLRQGLFSKQVYLVAGVKNILDVTTVTAVAQGSAHSSSGNEQAIGTGRSYFVKLQIALTK